jgi:glycine C-acetyltransferase
MTFLNDRLHVALESIQQAGTYKVLRHVTAPMGPETTIDGVGKVVVFCSNNYLGLANHPMVIEAAAEGLRRYGAGTASVRFICGTFECHRALEEATARFLGCEAALSFTSCWNANEGLLPALANEGDAIVSDETNHASIIDAGRLTNNAHRGVFAHSDMAALESALVEVNASPLKLVVTDGVFSMEGDVAHLAEMRTLCDRFDATLVVDDSHGTGVLGDGGRGTPHHFGLSVGNGVDILTSTYGKALGGGNGGFVAGSQALVDYLVQRSRPHLFSNALAPPLACAARAAIEVLEEEPERVDRLHANVTSMRTGLRELGYDVKDSPTGIIPIMIGDTAEAIRMSDRLLDMGVFVVGFGFPVVPEGAARLRVQMSSEHSASTIDRALEAFAKVRP